MPPLPISRRPGPMKAPARLSALATGLAAALVFAGCGSADPDPAAGSAGPVAATEGSTTEPSTPTIAESEADGEGESQAEGGDESSEASDAGDPIEDFVAAAVADQSVGFTEAEARCAAGAMAPPALAPEAFGHVVISIETDTNLDDSVLDHDDFLVVARGFAACADMSFVTDEVRADNPAVEAMLECLDEQLGEEETTALVLFDVLIDSSDVAPSPLVAAGLRRCEPEARRFLDDVVVERVGGDTAAISACLAELGGEELAVLAESAGYQSVVDDAGLRCG